MKIGMHALLAVPVILVLTAGSPGALSQTLVSSVVPGKLGYKPGSNFCEAVITPATQTAYLSGMTGGTNSTDFKGEVKVAMDALKNTLAALGSSMDAAVKTTVFLTNIDHFADMNSVYTTYFKNTLPARSTIEVASLVGTTQIEIDMIAVDPVFGTMKASS